MTTEKTPTGLNRVLSVTGGLVFMLLAGLILYPLVYEIFDAYFELDLSGKYDGYTKGDYIIFVTVLVWIFLSCLTGGFIAARISNGKEYEQGWILTGIVLAILLIFAISDSDSFDLSSLIILTGAILMVILGFRTGTRISMRYKGKRSIDNTASSPPGNP